MSEQKWSFDQTGTSGTSGTSPFGQTSTSSQPPSGNLFGSVTSPPASSRGGGLFGSTPAASASGTGFFGSNPATSSSTPGLFGASAGGNKTSSSFGGGGGGSVLDSAKPSQFTGFGTSGTSQASQPGTTATSSTPTFSFGTPNKPSEPSNNSQGRTPKPLFGGLGSSLSSQTTNTTSTTTPTSKPTTSLFANSTTPAGPPPNTSVGAGSTLFSAPKAQDQPPLFGNTSQPATSTSNASATAAAPARSIFDTSNKGSSNLFENQQSSQPKTDLFSAFTKPKEHSEQNAPSSQFGGQTQTTSAAPAETSTPLFGATPTAPGFNFMKTSAPSTSAPTVSSPAPTNSAPSLFPPSSVTPSSSTPATSAATSSLFSPKPQNATNDTTNPPTANATTSSSAFSGLGKPSLASAPPLGSSQPANQSASKPATNDAAQTTNLSTSTAGPLPPAQSRLKNKSMDEIINKWATDLSKYQKEFQTQAEKVARWDRMLVENSEKIQKLYGQTLEAERATTEVERQLSAVENDQAELESWLNHYEKEVDNMIGQQGDGEATTGPDNERQRTYQLAGRLSERLDEMNKDLASMIDEINDASSNLSRTSKKNDPLSQVVRVLNGHLIQLQQIDQGASALTQKVHEAQRASRAMPLNGRSSTGIGRPNSEAVDGFWRSYMGRR